MDNGADPELVDSLGKKPVELFWERAFSGQFNNEDCRTVASTFEASDFLDHQQFATIHKTVLRLVEKDLEAELKFSAAFVNNVDAQGRTALCWTTIRDDSTAVETLLKFRANPNIPDHEGNTCLLVTRSVVVCRSLLHYKANVHLRNTRYSRSALHNSCKREGTVGMINVLVEAGIDINVRDADGETPLLNAIFRRFTAAAQKLIDLGADVNAANYSSGESAIHFAVQFDYHEVLQLLLHRGADYTVRNVKGRNIGHLAARTAGPKSLLTLAEAKLTQLELSARDEDGNTAADYLAKRALISQNETKIPAAFRALVESVCSYGPLENQLARPSIVDLEAQRDHGCRPPGAYPIYDDEHESSKDEVHRETVPFFSCHYKSPCCYIFDAPRGVCLGVISYQSR